MAEYNPPFIYTGESISLLFSYLDLDGNYFDPTDARLTITKNVNQYVAGPFTAEAELLTRLSIGQYSYDWTPSPTIVPGIYRAKWEGTISEGNFIVYYFEFQILDPPIEPSTILDPPRTEGIIRPSPLFGKMGLGSTDRLFLIGHAGGLQLNDPYQVGNVQEALNILGGDYTSPMVRGLMEAYSAGARDVWLVAAAPQSEYVSFDISDEENRFLPHPEWDGMNFYERYAYRLEATYELIKGNDIPEIICLLEAPFYDTRGVDFLTPLEEHCAESFALTGVPRIGFLGTRIINQTSDDITAMIEDERLVLDPESDAYPGAKFVMVVVGEGTVSLTAMPVAHTTSLSTVAAAALAKNEWHRGMTYRQLPNVIGITANDLTKAQVKALANAKLNPVIRTERARRGNPYQIVTACDNTLSADGSDFWAISTTRIILKIINQIRAVGNRYIGSVDFLQFKQDVRNVLAAAVTMQYIRSYDLKIEQSKENINTVTVEVGILPYTSIREILFTVEVGLGA